jgi:hypothetical protein
VLDSSSLVEICSFAGLCFVRLAFVYGGIDWTGSVLFLIRGIAERNENISLTVATSIINSLQIRLGSRLPMLRGAFCNSLHREELLRKRGPDLFKHQLYQELLQFSKELPDLLISNFLRSG